MDKIVGQIIITSFSGLFLYLFGGYDMAFKVLVTLVVIDYVTGIMVAIINKKLSSQLSIKGIFKKIAILTTLIVAVLIDRMMGTEMLRMGALFCLCGNEGISVLENLSNLGAPIPQQVVDVLLQIKGKGGTLK